MQGVCCMCVCVCVFVREFPLSLLYKHPPNLFLIRLSRGQACLLNIDLGSGSGVQDLEKLEEPALALLCVWT